MTAFTECVVERASLVGLNAGGWPVAHCPAIAPDTTAAGKLIVSASA